MTTVLNPPVHRSDPRRLRDEEVAELSSLTGGLPHLSTPLPLDLADGTLRLEAALWEVAQRHEIELCPECSVYEVIEALVAKGWTTGAARDALRAVAMLAAGEATSDDPRAALAFGRLIGYFELRSRLG